MTNTKVTSCDMRGLANTFSHGQLFGNMERTGETSRDTGVISYRKNFILCTCDPEMNLDVLLKQEKGCDLFGSDADIEICVSSQEDNPEECQHNKGGSDFFRCRNVRLRSPSIRDENSKAN